MMYIKSSFITFPVLLIQALAAPSEVKIGERGSFSLSSFAMLSVAD